MQIVEEAKIKDLDGEELSALTNRQTQIAWVAARRSLRAHDVSHASVLEHDGVLFVVVAQHSGLAFIPPT